MKEVYTTKERFDAGVAIIRREIDEWIPEPRDCGHAQWKEILIHRRRCRGFAEQGLFGAAIKLLPPTRHEAVLAQFVMIGLVP